MPLNLRGDAAVADNRHLKNMEQQLLDEGLLMEAGWVGLRRIINNHVSLSPDQLELLREAFFAGAVHVFTSVLRALDLEGEPTDADMRRMEMLDNELRKSDQELRLKYAPAEGSS